MPIDAIDAIAAVYKAGAPFFGGDDAASATPFIA